MSTKEKVDALKIHILNNEYTVNCPIDQRQELMASADYLNTQMQNIKREGKILEFDKIAIMAALNISFDLLQYKKHEDTVDSTNHYGQMKRLHNKIDSALNDLLQLEI